MLQFDAKRVGSLLVVGIVFAVLPVVLPGTMQREITRLAVFAGSAMTLNLLVGAIGLISLGQGLFFGFGAYVVAVATIQFGVPYWHSVLAALVLAVPLSLLVAVI